MRLIFIVSISLIAIPLFGSELIIKLISDGRQFLAYETKGSYYSESCLKKRCLANEFRIPTELARQINSQINFSNPGDKICLGIDGTPFVARFENRDEQSFCLFKDKSFVDCGTLYAESLKISKGP